MEQTCHISRGSEQEAETTPARKTEDRELCADESLRRAEGVGWRLGIEDYSQGQKVSPPGTHSGMWGIRSLPTRTIKLKPTTRGKAAGHPWSLFM